MYPDVSLKLFGSCANGFETSTSDMDICIVFPPDSPQASSLSDNTERLSVSSYGVLCIVVSLSTRLKDAMEYWNFHAHLFKSNFG